VPYACRPLTSSTQNRCGCCPGGNCMRRSTAVWPTLLATALAACVVGCCHQGYVLQGTWSLGFVRPPQAACPCDDEACASECGCPAGACDCPPGACTCPGGRCTCPAGACTCPGGAGRCRAGGYAHRPGCPAAGGADHLAGADGVRGRNCGRGKRGDQRVAAGGPTGPALGHPRFHPVPTKPVFGPGTGPQVTPVNAPLPDDGPQLGEPQDPEELPTPRSSPNSARRRGHVQPVSGEMPGSKLILRTAD